MKKVVVAGHICVDITPIFPEGKVADLGDVLRPGKLVNMNGVKISTGGTVPNTGVGMSMLGEDVKLMGMIGNDEFGGLILEALKGYGYGGEKDMIVTDKAGTSYTVALAVPGIDRVFLHYPGANDIFTSDNLDYDKIAEADLFHFGYPPLMRSMYIDEGEELVKIFKKVKELGVTTSLDMAFVDPASEAGRANWREIIRKVIPYVDIFVPSIEELCCMLDRPRFDAWNERAGGTDVTMMLHPEEDIRPLADDLLAMGAKMLMIKCGAPGLYFRTADARKLQSLSELIDPKVWGGLEWFEKSYKPEKVLSGTGAGDTSIAAFLTALLEGKTPQRALQIASGEGTSCVEAYDALGGLRTIEQIEEKIDAGWEKQDLVK